MSEALDPVDFGFVLVGQRRDGTRQYSLQANPFLVYWLTARPDGTGDFSYEFALGEYLKAKGFAISGQDELSLLLFPDYEARGPLDQSWLAGELEQAQELLGSVDLLRAT